MAGKEGGDNPNHVWEKRNVTTGEEPIEVSEQQRAFENRINDIPEDEWNQDPQQAYGRAVVGDLDEKFNHKIKNERGRTDSV
ncbi:MAG TPA: hypothetical protein PK863_03290 [Candidatus Dojkabacteria bacterium]|nr:hypothetical protein [Candidatus Dojkabacteria bacterium]HRP38038.1 hypothetical protein [Candidatus Dojkabacteria bacterium]HRP51768.1 hypothetical protein [Candidatus Dojkabacteria bacterium]